MAILERLHIMGHGVWHASGAPINKLTASPALRGNDDTRVRRGDKITVLKDGVKVRIMAEFVSDDSVEGTVLRATKKWSKGSYIHVSRSNVVTEGKSPRIGHAMSKAEESEILNA